MDEQQKRKRLVAADKAAAFQKANPFAPKPEGEENNGPSMFEKLKAMMPSLPEVKKEETIVVPEQQMGEKFKTFQENNPLAPGASNDDRSVFQRIKKSLAKRG